MVHSANPFVVDLDWVVLRVRGEMSAIDRDKCASEFRASLWVEVRNLNFRFELYFVRMSVKGAQLFSGVFIYDRYNEIIHATVCTTVLDVNEHVITGGVS